MWQFFCGMRIKWYYFLKTSFHLICANFWMKIKKFLKFEKLEKMIKQQGTLKKKTFSFEKASLPKSEGAKYAGF